MHACIHSMHMSLLATSVLLKTTTSLAEREGGQALDQRGGEHWTKGGASTGPAWLQVGGALGSKGGRYGSFIL